MNHEQLIKQALLRKIALGTSLSPPSTQPGAGGRVGNALKSTLLPGRAMVKQVRSRAPGKNVLGGLSTGGLLM